MSSDVHPDGEDVPNERERKSASEPERGPRADLYQAFDDLPGMASDSITDGRLTEAQTDVAEAVREWIDGDAEAPEVEVILELIEDTGLHLVLHLGQGACVIRHTESGHYERVSLLRNDKQVHELQAETDEARFGAKLVNRASVRDWLGEYAGDTPPAFQVTAAALLSPDQTDIWRHASRAGIREEVPV